MHWTEIAAVAIIVGALIPVSVLLAYVIRFGWSVLQCWTESRRMEIDREFSCAQGTFVREHHAWVAVRQIEGRQLRLDARDENGAPDSKFLHELTRIIAGVSDFEQLARKHVSEVTGHHNLESILSPVRPDDDYDFALGFAPDNEHEHEISIFVNFKQLRVVGWTGID